MGNIDIPQKHEVKSLGSHLDRRLTWAKHVKTIRKKLNQTPKQMHWLLGRSTLSIERKLYKAVLKPLWTYGIQLWGTTSNSNIEFPQRFQSKIRRSILNAPWYINNHRIPEDLQMNTVVNEKSGISNTRT
jgi:hypothetical protein